MSDYKKRSTKRRKKREASLIGDLFRILFAVSMLIVAILVSFYVYKNVNGFKLPDLKTTLPALETTAAEVVIETEEKQESESNVEETGGKQELNEKELKEAEEEVESRIKAVEAKEQQDGNEIKGSLQNDINKSADSVTKKASDDVSDNEKKPEKKNTKQEVEEKKDVIEVGEDTKARNSEKKQSEIIEAPEAQGNLPVVSSEGPVTEEDGAVISNDGPVANG